MCILHYTTTEYYTAHGVYWCIYIQYLVFSCLARENFIGDVLSPSILIGSVRKLLLLCPRNHHDYTTVSVPRSLAISKARSSVSTRTTESWTGLDW